MVGYTAATAGSALRGGDGANGSPRGIRIFNPFPWAPGGAGQAGSNNNSWAAGGGGGGSGYINPSTVTGGNTYPYSNTNSFDHPLRGDAGTKGIYGTDIGYGSGRGASGKIVLS